MEPSGPTRDEELSSPTSSPPTPAASASASSQPTYTTAGTIYNPSSSQRLQPPTRRGRLLKLNSETTGFSLDAIKFGSPRSMLSDAQFRSDATVKVPAAAAIQQYSPLQQNYDRAVSPVVSPDHDSEMLSRVPKLHNLPPYPRVDSPPPSLLDKGKGKAVATADASSSDDEDDTFTGALMNMTVKSLQNLASYPNPSQKNAQKALLRGTRPKAGSSLGGGPSRLGTPFTTRAISPGGARVSSSDLFSTGLRPTLSDPTALHQSYVDNRWRWRSRTMASEAGPSGTHHSAFESRFSTPSTNSDNTDPNPSASMHLATGPGAPKPLTAGPPGQRQYRPSTFESTFKALKTQPTASQGSIAEVEEEHSSFAFKGPSTMPSTPQGSTVEDGEYLSASESMFNPINAMPIAYQNAPAEYERDSVISPDSLLYLTINSVPDWPEGSQPCDQTCRCDCSALDRAAREMAAQEMAAQEMAAQEMAVQEMAAREMGGTSVVNSSTQTQGNYGPIGSGSSRRVPTLSQSESYLDDDEWDEPITPMFPQSMGYTGRLTPREVEEQNWRLNFLWYVGTGLLGHVDAAPAVSQPVYQNANQPVARNIYGAVGDGRPTQNEQDSSAARGDGTWPARSRSLNTADSDITNAFALLDQVLSRAT